MTNIRRSVCIMANRLRKQGLSLSEAFRKAWRRVKLMKFRACGVTFGLRQKALATLSTIRPQEMRCLLQRERNNEADANAIRIVIQLPSIGKQAVIGYVPAALASELAAVMDAGIGLTATASIIGGYGYKETYGALIEAKI